MTCLLQRQQLILKYVVNVVSLLLVKVNSVVIAVQLFDKKFYNFSNKGKTDLLDTLDSRFRNSSPKMVAKKLWAVV